MSSPRFLADEDLRRSIVSAVKRRAPHIEITTIIAEDLMSLDDEMVLEFAWNHHWIVVSHDVNTMKATAERRVAQGRGMHGLLLAAQRKSTLEIAESLVMIANASMFGEWRGRIVYLPI